MRKKKGIALVLSVLCLSAGAAGTLAYMNDSGQIANQLVFAGEKGLDAVLTEPSWKAESALLTVPGSVIPKDPQITNTSELDMNELVAVKCQFIYSRNCPDKSKRGTLLSPQDMEKAVQVYAIDYNSDDRTKGNWIRFAGQTKSDAVQCFYYSEVLKRNIAGIKETTIPLFTKVQVDKSVNNRKQEWIREIGGIDIKISGQVLQQMTGEENFGLDNPKNAYEAGLFDFKESKGKERMRISREKRNILFAGAISCAMLFGIGNTMAYFTENAVQTNVFTTGDLDIGLKEPGWDPEDNDGKNMYPGYTVYKNPTVKNITSDKNGDEPCYVRMTVDILNNQGSPVTDNQALNLIYKTIYFDKTFNGSYDKKEGYGTGLVQDRIPGYSLAQLASYPMVNPLWVKDTSRSTASSLVFNYMGEKGDGILDIGEESTLFTNVVIPTDWNQTQMQKVGNYQLKVTAQAIQSKGFASQSEAYRMLDEEIKGGTLQEIERDSQN